MWIHCLLPLLPLRLTSAHAQRRREPLKAIGVSASGEPHLSLRADYPAKRNRRMRREHKLRATVSFEKSPGPQTDAIDLFRWFWRRFDLCTKEAGTSKETGSRWTRCVPHCNGRHWCCTANYDEAHQKDKMLQKDCSFTLVFLAQMGELTDSGRGCSSCARKMVLFPLCTASPKDYM